MQKPEDQLKDYLKMVQDIDLNYTEAIKYWWNKWHRCVEYDTELEMLTTIPDWVKNMIAFVEHLSELKCISIKYNYERGLFQTNIKTTKATPTGIEY